MPFPIIPLYANYNLSELGGRRSSHIEVCTPIDTSYLNLANSSENRYGEIASHTVHSITALRQALLLNFISGESINLNTTTLKNLQCLMGKSL